MYPQPQAMYAPGYVGSGRNGQPGYEDVPNYPTYLPPHLKKLNELKKKKQIQPSPTYGAQPNPAATYNPSFGWMGGGGASPGGGGGGWQRYPTLPPPPPGQPPVVTYAPVSMGGSAGSQGVGGGFKPAGSFTYRPPSYYEPMNNITTKSQSRYFG